MTVLDDIRMLEERVTARLDELRPLVEEYRELERAARRLGVDPSKSRSARPKQADGSSGGSSTRLSRGSSTRPAGRRSSRRQGAKPARRDQVLALVNERPGITVPDMGVALKADPTGLYRVVRGLEKEGVVKKEGRAVRPV